MLRTFAEWLFYATKPEEKIIRLENDCKISLQNVIDIYQLYNQSTVVYEVTRLKDVIEDKNTLLQGFELEAIDQMIEAYNIRFKSPLAKAMMEDSK